MKRHNVNLTLVESILNKEKVEAPFSCDSIYLYHLHLLGCQCFQSPALKGFEIGLSPSQAFWMRLSLRKSFAPPQFKMLKQDYDWKRFCCPRSGRINLAGGYLDDPDAEFGKANNPDLVTSLG